MQKKIGQKFGGRQKFCSKKFLSKKFVPKIIFVKENVASKIMLVQYMTIQKNDGAKKNESKIILLLLIHF